MANRTDDVRGLYFPEPHAGLLMNGEKNLVAKAAHEPGHRTRDLRGEWLLVTKRGGCGLVLGAVGIGEPFAVGSKEFGKWEPMHRVSRKERMSWWADRDELWLYPVQWRVELPEPRRCIVPAGTQTVMRGVETEAGDRFLEKAADVLPDEIPWTAGFVWFDDGQVITGSGIDAEAALGAEVAAQLKAIAEQHPGTQGACPIYDLVLRRRKRLEYIGPSQLQEIKGQGEGAEAGTSTATAAALSLLEGRTKAQKGDRQTERMSALDASGKTGERQAKSQTKQAGNVPDESPSPTTEPISLVVVCEGDVEGEYLIGARVAPEEGAERAAED